MRAVIIGALMLVARTALADEVTVTLEKQNGEVVVDGKTHVILQDGVARLVLPPGDHQLTVVPNEQVPRPFPTREVVAGSLLGLGVVSLLVSAGFFNEYLSNQEDGKNPALRQLYPATQTPDSLCAGASHAPSLDEVCRLNDESKKHSTLAVLTAASGVLFVSAGLVILFTSGAVDKPRPVPMVAPGAAGMSVVGTF